MSKVINVQVLKKEMHSDNVLFLYMNKPKGFEYQAGQFVELRLRKSGEWYSFTLASAPLEEKLFIVTRVRESEFKQNLLKLGAGDEVELTGPWGNFILSDSLPPQLVFLAGGLGVNVFRSMLVQNHLSHDKVLLFVSVRDEGSLVFHDELQRMSGLTYVPTLTGDIPDNWHGERGRITAGLISKYGLDKNALVYIVGHTGFVHGMLQEFDLLGFPFEQIRVEHFSGY